MRHVPALVIFAMSCATIAAGEDRPLQAIDRPAISGEKRCLPYFAVTTFGGAAPEQIIFAYQGADGNIKRDTVPKSRTLVQVSEKQTPTYATIPVDGQSGALFRLSQDEYEKARECLPEPKPESKSAR